MGFDFTMYCETFIISRCGTPRSRLGREQPQSGNGQEITFETSDWT
jgi:hypothetical protein